jgi:hypothetical protein
VTRAAFVAASTSRMLPIVLPAICDAILAIPL